MSILTTKLMTKGGNVKRLLLAGVLIAAIAVPIGVISQEAGQGLEISPPRLEQNVDPGESLAFDIKLRNVTSGDLVVTSQVDDFGASDDETGNPRLLLDTEEQTSFGLKDWVEAIGEQTIASQEQATIPVKINVPENASPGGHYGVIRFSGTAPGLDDTGVSLNASIGALVLLRVSGDVVEQASVEELSVSKDGNKGTLFETGPLQITARIKNDGNVHIKPAGQVTVKNVFGQEIGTLVVNEKAGNVLPDSIRKFEQTLEKKTMFGRYSAQLDLTYGDNKSLQETVAFWVIPYKLVAIVLAALIVVFTIIRLSLRGYRRRVLNQNSVNQAQ